MTCSTVNRMSKILMKCDIVTETSAIRGILTHIVNMTASSRESVEKVSGLMEEKGCLLSNLFVVG